MDHPPENRDSPLDEPPSRAASPRLLRWGVPLVVLGFLAIVVEGQIRSHFRARSGSRLRHCPENLTKIDGAKEQWALEHNRTIGDAPPTVQDLVAPPDGSGGYLRAFPVCPNGGHYTIGPLGSDPTCDSGLPGHSLSEIVDAITDISADLLTDIHPMPEPTSAMTPFEG